MIDLYKLDPMGLAHADLVPLPRLVGGIVGNPPNLDIGVGNKEVRLVSSIERVVRFRLVSESMFSEPIVNTLLIRRSSFVPISADVSLAAVPSVLVDWDAMLPAETRDGLLSHATRGGDGSHRLTSYAAAPELVRARQFWDMPAAACSPDSRSTDVVLVKPAGDGRWINGIPPTDSSVAEVLDMHKIV